MVLWVEFLLVGILCLVMVISSIAFGRGSTRRRQAEADKAVDEEMARRLSASQSEVSDLRARLEVLEKLATDPEQRIAAEIEKLKRDGDNRPGASN
jgi:hypothetical protein